LSAALEAGARALQQRFGAEVLCAVAPVDGDVRGLRPPQRELAAGRVHARALLARLVLEPAPLLAASDRAPRRPLGFHDLEIALDSLAGRFRARLLRRSPTHVALAGFHCTCAGSVVTGMALTAQAGACP